MSFNFSQKSRNIRKQSILINDVQLVIINLDLGILVAALTPILVEVICFVWNENAILKAIVYLCLTRLPPIVDHGLWVLLPRPRIRFRPTEICSIRWPLVVIVPVFLFDRAFRIIACCEQVAERKIFLCPVGFPLSEVPYIALSCAGTVVPPHVAIVRVPLLAIWLWI